MLFCITVPKANFWKAQENWCRCSRNVCPKRFLVDFHAFSIFMHSSLNSAQMWSRILAKPYFHAKGTTVNLYHFSSLTNFLKSLISEKRSSKVFKNLQCYPKKFRITNNLENILKFKQCYWSCLEYQESLN